MVSTILFHKLYDYLILYNNLGLILQNIVIFVNIFVTFLYYSDIIIPCVLQSHIIIFQICLTTLPQNNRSEYVQSAPIIYKVHVSFFFFLVSLRLSVLWQLYYINSNQCSIHRLLRLRQCLLVHRNSSIGQILHHCAIIVSLKLENLLVS